MHASLRAESNITLGGRRYWLRPTFGALARIESLTGQPVTQLMGYYLERGIPRAHLPLLLEALLEGAGETMPTYRILHRRKTWKTAQKTVLTCLFQGIGGEQTGHAPLSWESMLQTAVTVLGIPPSDFWQLTLPEFHIACQGVARGMSDTDSAYLTSEDVTELRTFMQTLH